MVDERTRSCIEVGAHERHWPMLGKPFAEGYMHGRTGTIGVTSAYQIGSLDREKLLASFVRERRAELFKEEAALVKELGDLDGKKLRLKILTGFSDLLKEKNITIIKPDGSIVHKLVSAGLSGKIQSITNKDAAPETEIEFWTYVRDSVNAFVIEHNWAAVVGNDAEGEFVFPYSCCAFEMTVCGYRVVYIHGAEHDGFFAQFNGEWAGAIVDENFKRSEGLTSFVYNQVRAVCISLDAEVAVASVTRAPHLLNSAREKKGQLPLYDYRTVQLSRRSHLSQKLPPSDDANKTKKRLHFRRGHWRHFHTHKTWIRWMLVGDPDLGFVDKHYRA